MAKEAASVNDSPQSVVTIAKPTQLGVWDPVWKNENTLEYQNGFYTHSTTFQDGSEVLSTRGVQSRGRGLLDTNDLETAGTLPDTLRELINSFKNISIPDGEELRERYGEDLFNSSAFPEPNYCVRQFIGDPPSGGGTVSTKTPTPIDGGNGGDGDESDDHYCDPTRGSTSTSTTSSTTKTTTSTTTTTTTSTTNICEQVHKFSMGLPKVMGAVRNFENFLTNDFTTNCYGGKPVLRKIPLHNEILSYDCNNNKIEVYKTTIWIGIDMKMLDPSRGQNCPLYVGITEEVAGGAKETDICTSFCEEGQKFGKVLHGIADASGIRGYVEIAESIARWSENNSVAGIKYSTILQLVVIALVLLGIIAGGIYLIGGIGGGAAVGVSHKTAVAIIGLLLGILGGG